MKKRILLFGGIFALLLTGCGNPELQDGKEVVLEIDGYKVTAEDLYKDLVSKYGTTVGVNLVDSYIADKEVKTTDAMEDEVEQTINMYRDQLGEEFDSAVLQAGYESEAHFREELLYSTKKNTVVENYLKTTITDEEIQKYYDETLAPKMDVRHILIKPEEGEDADESNELKETALNEAKDLIKRLNEGEDFVELAKEFSDDSSAEDGGLITDVTEDGFVAEFVEAARELEKDDYTSEPVETMYGYHIILKVEDKEKDSLEDSKEYITSKLLEALLAEEGANEAAWVEIRKNYNLNIFDKTIKNVYELNN